MDMKRISNRCVYSDQGYQIELIGLSTVRYSESEKLQIDFHAEMISNGSITRDLIADKTVKAGMSDKDFSIILVRTMRALDYLGIKFVVTLW